MRRHRNRHRGSASCIFLQQRQQSPWFLPPPQSSLPPLRSMRQRAWSCSSATPASPHLLLRRRPALPWLLQCSSPTSGRWRATDRVREGAIELELEWIQWLSFFAQISNIRIWEAKIYWKMYRESSNQSRKGRPIMRKYMHTLVWNRKAQV